jgi:hypothetical protein
MSFRPSILKAIRQYSDMKIENLDETNIVYWYTNYRHLFFKIVLLLHSRYINPVMFTDINRYLSKKGVFNF